MTCTQSAWIALKMFKHTRAKVPYNWLIVMFSESLSVWPAASFEDFFQSEAGSSGIRSQGGSSTMAGELCDINPCIFEHRLGPLTYGSIWDSFVRLDITDE